jgi:hypothetical protein
VSDEAIRRLEQTLAGRPRGARGPGGVQPLVGVAPADLLAACDAVSEHDGVTRVLHAGAAQAQAKRVSKARSLAGDDDALLGLARGVRDGDPAALPALRDFLYERDRGAAAKVPDPLVYVQADDLHRLLELARPKGEPAAGREGGGPAPAPAPPSPPKEG